MIQYYLGKVIRELAYLLRPIFSGTESPYVVDFVPLEEKYERLEQSNEPLGLSTQGEVSGFDFQQFTANKITNIDSEYALKKIDFDMTPFTDAVLAISPTDENGYSFLVVKNVIKSYFLSYKGQSKTYFTLGKGDAQRSVEFIVLRISPTELVFLGDTDGWLYEFYYDQERASGIYDLNNATRKFSNVPDVAYLNILNSSYGYFFRARGQDPDGNWTEWSTTYIDGTDAFYLPKYDQEVANEYMPELEKFTLTNDKFSIISYPNFEQGLRMAGIKYNGNNYFLRETDIDKIFATSPDNPIPMSLSTVEFARFNPTSPEYPAFLTELQTTNLNVRSQLELAVIANIPRTVDVSITRTSDTTYLVEAIGNETSANLKFKKESDGTIDDKGLQSLPYTYTHASGEVWEVDAGNGYVNAWGIYVPLNGYLESVEADALQYANAMRLKFYWTGEEGSENTQSLWGKMHQSLVGNRYYFAIRLQEDNKVSVYSQKSTITTGRGSSVNIGWNDVGVYTDGSNITFNVNGTITTDTINPDSITTDSIHNFRIGADFVGENTKTEMMYAYYYQHGTEVFNMNEGAGTTTVGSEGTILNLEGGATWVKI